MAMYGVTAEKAQQVRGIDIHPYYERTGHHTSIAALMMAFFAVQGALVMGGLVSIFMSGAVVWVATALGSLAGVVVYSLCYVSSHASRLENDIMTIKQIRASGEGSEPING